MSTRATNKKPNAGREQPPAATTSAPAVHCTHDQLVPLAELKPHPRNPRTHPVAQVQLLAKLIRHHGWRRPIVVSKRSGCIVAGHGALAAARTAGFPVAPVNFQDFVSDADELAYLSADNSVAAYAETDDATLQSLLAELGDDFDRELAGILAELDTDPLPPAPPLPAKDKRVRCPKCKHRFVPEE